MPARRLMVTAATLMLLAAACGGADDGLRAQGDDGAETTTEGADSTRPDDTTASSDTAADSTDTSSGAADDGETGAIEWGPCESDRDLDCGTLEVPLDYDDPEAGTITLALKRSRATDEDSRIGPLLVNPGGPGVSTLDEQLVEVLPVILDDRVVERFDIIGWDPRGVGQSDHIDCVDDLDPYIGALDPTPDTPDERAAYDTTSEDFVEQCETNSGELLPHVSTQDSARDMDEIRKALGEDQISYLGFSYGSELGATFATMFPDSVRAVVIDGATNPSADYATVTKEQSVGIERALDNVLADCADDPSCAFHNDGDPAAAYDALFESLDAEPLPAPDGRPDIGQAIMAWATISSLYDQSQWSDFTDALADAQAGDGEGLLDLYDSYWSRSADGSWNNSYEALIAINCVDESTPLTDAEVEALVDELSELSPRTGSWFAEQNTCQFWPAHEAPLEITGAGAGPILVLGNTGDPVTPIESTEAMARALEEGVLVSFDGTGHTAYIEAYLADNSCVIDAVTEYLVDLTPPSDDLTCG